MARNIIDIGVEGNDGTGDSIRESFRKTNENFRELYAVFGIGGQISFANLDDVPDEYTDQANKIVAVNSAETGLEYLELVSDGAVTGDPLDDTIKFNVTLSGKLLIQAGRTKTSNDPDPELGGHLNADEYAIGNLTINDTVASQFASKYGGNYTVHDLVPDKKYTDARYAKATEPGKMGGVRSEPADASEYTLTATATTSTQDLQIANHGLDHASNGVEYKYSSTTSAPTGLTNNTNYFVRVINNSAIALYPTKADALANTNKINITTALPTGTHTLVDQTYDATLEGFWLKNEVLPRQSVVRRQGDKMAGPLFASDHPGALAGTTPLAEDDLQVATKLYVDNAETTTASNLYVSTLGNDNFTVTAPSKAGRSPSYAFKTIGAAARKAEEIQIASKFELGNYAQTITTDEFTVPTTVTAAAIKTIPAGRTNMKTLIDENIKFIKAETIAFINDTYPSFVYNQDICARDVGLIVNAAKLDSLTGNNANFLSRRAGIRYYASASGLAAINLQKTETVAAITFVKNLVNLILQNQTPATTYQSLYTQYVNTGLTTDSTTRSSISAKFDIVTDIINDGNAFDAPAVVDGSVYQVKMGNGTLNSFVDQGNPDNTDILPGKIVRGKQSRAIGRVISYISEDSTPANGANTDILELQLLEPIEFILGEELEYANEIKFDQITIRVESGTYEEDFPIRIPANVSLKGDEFRRVIIRPVDRASQSPWANIYFYRDAEFDGLRNDTGSVTGIAEPNLPKMGTTYVDPLTGNPQGFFGRHYLTDPTSDVNVSNFGKTNPGKFTQAAKIISNNEDFIVEEVIAYVDATYPSLVYDRTKCRRDTRYIVQGLVTDLKDGGRKQSLANQGAYYAGAVAGQVTETEAAIQYISTLANDLLQNNTITALSSEQQIIDTSLTAEATAYTNLDALVDLVAYAFNANINTARNNKELDVFLCNDGNIVRNCSVTGHGGFMMVLDPEGQVKTKSPYCQTGSSFSAALNRQAFRGGMLVDAFVGNTPMNVVGVTNPFEIDVESDPNEGLFIRRPQTPAPFYIEGRRFQVNAVRDYDQTTGTATLILDPSSNKKTGFTGTFYGSVDLSTASPGNPIEITLQTAGNRSMLGNDFTQVNDLGYGLIVNNGGLSEMVSQFTYYCWTAYYANNGGQIRSLNGSNAYGEYGLVANGSDPNEIPDAVTIRDNMVKPALTMQASTVLEFANPIGFVAEAGHEVTQGGATGTVVIETSGKKLYLKDVTGSFTTTGGDVTLNDSSNLGAPDDVDNPDLTMAAEKLNIYAYDFPSKPQNTAEVDILHPNGTKARYEVTSVSAVKDFRVGGHINVPYTATATGNGAAFDIQNIRSNTDSTGTGQYVPIIRAPGTGYSVGDTFDISGGELDGTTANDCQITVDTVDSAGVIKSVSATGDVNIISCTPYYDGQVYTLKFSNETAGYSNDGLITALEEDVGIIFRQNQTFILDNVNDPESIKTRPSTAFELDDKPGFTYRTTSFANTETTGERLPGANQTKMTIDSTFDYVRVIVDPDHTSDAVQPGFGGTTLGATAGDVGIAIEPLTEVADITRLRRGDMVFAWDGKTHLITDYIPRSGYAILKFTDYMDPFSPSGYITLNDTYALGLHSSVVLSGTQTNTIRCGMQAGSPGDLTIDISLCRATGHDFLDIGTGSYNQSNYPNVLLGAPRAPNQSYEVQERSKGRVFYVSTDQDGFFHVGRFFTVDQGTGTVTFAGSIALSNLDGIGFKRGVVVAEFSTDDGMTQNGSDIVPTQNAVRGYVNRRLGWDHNGTLLGNIIGGGAVARNGSTAMTGNFNAGSFRLTNVAAPATGSDAANKTYVDTVAAGNSEFDNLRDTNIQRAGIDASLSDNAVYNGQLVHYTGDKILFLDGSAVTDGPFVTNFKNSIITSGSKRGWVQKVTTGTDPVIGSIIKIVYNDSTLTGDAFTGNETDIAQDELQRGLDQTYLTYNGAAGVDANFWVTCGLTYGVVLIGNAGSGYVAGETFTLPGTAFTGGASPANDGTITIDTVNGSGGITAVSITGTTGRATRPVAEGAGVAPMLEKANGRWNSASQIEFDVSQATDYLDVAYMIKDDSIVNADVNSAAAIAQSKLAMQAADTSAAAPGSFDQSLLGLAKFDSDDFDVTNGWVTLKSGSVDLADIEEIADLTALGNVSGASATPTEVSITKNGAADSLTMTKSDGKLRVGGLIVGADDTYTILQPKTGAATTIQMLTPGGATIFEATGTTDITAEFGASIDIGNSGADTQSNFQAASTYAGEARLSSDWMYTSFVEAATEKDGTSTGIALGAGTGKSSAGEIALVTNGDIGFKFSDAGVLPDVTNTYNIGSSTLKYNTVYATVFDGTATQARYADLAENYLADAEYEIGTVICLGGAKEITQSTTKGETSVFGVVSENPGFLMNKDLTGDFVTPVALTGRVKCKVIGRVKPGDMIVSSSIPGYGMTNSNPGVGTVIGKALEEKTTDDKGVIEIVVGRV